MVKIFGLAVHRATLAKLRSPKMRNEVGRAIFAAADIVTTTARKSIVKGAIQGKKHVPSRPGQPPKRDTAQLDSSIVTRKTGPLSAESRSEAPYSAHLEKGTSRMAARPFMKPAAQASRQKALDLVAAAVTRVSRRSR